MNHPDDPGCQGEEIDEPGGENDGFGSLEQQSTIPIDPFSQPETPVISDEYLADHLVNVVFGKMEMGGPEKIHSNPYFEIGLTQYSQLSLNNQSSVSWYYPDYAISVSDGTVTVKMDLSDLILQIGWKRESYSDGMTSTQTYFKLSITNFSYKRVYAELGISTSFQVPDSNMKYTMYQGSYLNVTDRGITAGGILVGSAAAGYFISPIFFSTGSIVIPTTR
jgi:hypothetical protein